MTVVGSGVGTMLVVVDSEFVVGQAGFAEVYTIDWQRAAARINFGHTMVLVQVQFKSDDNVEENLMRGQGCT